MNAYETASILTISKNKVKEKVHDLCKPGREAMQAMSKGQTGNSRRKFNNRKVNKRYKDITHSLFDVADDKNVPEIDNSFLEAQRKPGRVGSIAGVDLIEQRRVIKMEEKEAKKALKEEKGQ